MVVFAVDLQPLPVDLFEAVTTLMGRAGIGGAHNAEKKCTKNEKPRSKFERIELTHLVIPLK